MSNAASTDQSYLDRAKAYWRFAPGGGGKVDTAALLELPDVAFLDQWHRAKAVRRASYWEEGPFIQHFADRFRGRSIFSFGCGLGYSELDFLEAGCHVTFADIVPTNLASVKRLVTLSGQASRAAFLLMEDSAAMSFGGPYDVVFAYGSLMHMPADRQRRVLRAMLDSLSPGGEIVLMLYTRRFAQDGGAVDDATAFGRYSDPSVGVIENPWSDWHDDEKLLALCDPGTRILHRETWNDDRFVWYALGRASEHSAVEIRPFLDLAGDAARAAQQAWRTGLVLYDAPITEAIPHSAAVQLTADAIEVLTEDNRYGYAVSWPAWTVSGPPRRLAFDLDVVDGGLAIGILDVSADRFLQTITMTAPGRSTALRELAVADWPQTIRLNRLELPTRRRSIAIRAATTVLALAVIPPRSRAPSEA